MRRYIQQTLNPDWYHGHRKKPPFFEGWYFKIINAAEDARYAIIPGIFINPNPAKTHAFIQILDGMSGRATYHTYPAQQFVAAEDAFDVRIGPNHFRRDCLTLNIDASDTKVIGNLHFNELTPWPITWAAPGIMGWYGWIPFMECNHGIISLDHSINGELTINGERINFSGGRGYIEKDWGSNFPSGYIWQQSNHFEAYGTSLTASIAVISNLGFTFPGFIIGLWRDNKLYRFATYTGAKVERLEVTDSQVMWVVKDKQLRLEMRSSRAAGGALKGPEKLDMHKRVDETLQAIVETRLSTLSGRTIFSGIGRNAGLEVVGDLSLLLKS